MPLLPHCDRARTSPSAHVEAASSLTSTEFRDPYFPRDAIVRETIRAPSVCLLGKRERDPMIKLGCATAAIVLSLMTPVNASSSVVIAQATPSEPGSQPGVSGSPKRSGPAISPG